MVAYDMNGVSRANGAIADIMATAHTDPPAAWRVLVEPAGFPQAYDMLVDAGTGEVLYRHNRVYYADGVASVVQSDVAPFASVVPISAPIPSN